MKQHHFHGKKGFQENGVRCVTLLQPRQKKLEFTGLDLLDVNNFKILSEGCVSLFE